MTSSILQGRSIKGIADDLQTRIPTMNRNSAIRAARTAATGAQNAGRMDSYAAAEKMGIKLKREWVATLDNRTRHSHAMLDGQQAAIDKPFKVDGHEIMFPGDTSAPGYLVYNCRCTLAAVVDGEKSKSQRRARDPETGENVLVEDMTYQEWMAQKSAENATVWETYTRKGRNLSADTKQWKEYKAVLGRKAPNTIAGFQNLKYNEPEKWKQLKTDKRQTDFVNNAPCVTTPKKFSGYFLKPGAKHADQFFSVGYTESDVLQLRYDIVRQFDMSKAVDRSVDKNGAETFNIYMSLGVTKKKSFLTGWQVDAPGEKARIITGFRKDQK